MTEGSILVICIYELTSKFIHIPDLPYSSPELPRGSFLVPLLCHFLHQIRENRFSPKSGKAHKIRVLENRCFIRIVFEPRMLHHHQSHILSVSLEMPGVPSAT